MLLSPVLTGQSFGQILPPGNPRSVPPPDINMKTTDTDLKMKHKQRQDRDRSLRKPEMKPEEKRDLELYKAALEVREMNFMMQVSLVLPYVKVSGARKNYTADLTSHFHLFFRGSKLASTTDTNMWWGLRTAMFSGTGIYKNIPGRYGFTYFGPMIGLGKIAPGERSSGFDPARGDRLENQVFPSRQGWFWMFGIAAVSRTSKIEPTEKPIDQDFDRSGGVKFDKPGLWTEFTFATVHFGAVGVNVSLGAQLAQGKTYTYAGLGAAGWN
jgi:hypothetical protein